MYLYHINITTGESYRTREADGIVVARLKDWLQEPRTPLPLNDEYICTLQQRQRKLLDVIVKRQGKDVRRIVVCTHSRYKATAWGIIADGGKAPTAPFAACRILAESGDTLALDNFERDLAHAFFERQKPHELLQNPTCQSAARTNRESGA